MSPFGAILRRAVQATPGAIGGAFADSDGEMIDGFTTRDPQDWALLTAHYGVVLSLLHDALGTWHFGGPEYFIAQHAVMDIVVHAVDGGYYALLAVLEPAPLGHALRSLRRAARELHREML
jgi:predicted regulator of Ras-like GTPase activity (Roadblock/LC7/MglB family)